jgi:hypothetical protein
MRPALIPILGNLLEKLLPDAKAADEAKLRLMEMVQRGELAALAAETDLAKGQVAVNQVEAASERLFVSGWRPAVGWICAAAFGFKYIGGPLLVMIGQVGGFPVTLPQIDAGDLTPILLGMLGLGGLRTLEKVKGAA